MSGRAESRRSWFMSELNQLDTYCLSLSRVTNIYKGKAQGRRQEVLFGGGQIQRHSSPPTPKIQFLLDFGDFILKMLETAKFSYV